MGATKYDCIVIGGGHNGLVAGSYLAKKGKKVVVLEKNSQVGGLARGNEFHPGYLSPGILHDTCGFRDQVVRDLDLDKFGLRKIAGKPDTAFLGKEGNGVVITSDMAKTQENIARFSDTDAEAYGRYQTFINQIRPFVSQLLNQPPPTLASPGPGEIIRLLKTGKKLRGMGKKTMLEFLKVAPMSVYDFLNEYFETDFLKAGLAAPALYGSFTGPRSAYSTFNLLIWECMATSHLIGGPSNLIQALEKAAETYGVEILCNAEVNKIDFNNERAVTGVSLVDGTSINSDRVLATCTPQTIFLGLIPINHLPQLLEEGIGKYRSRGTTAKVNIALKGTPAFEFDTGVKVEYFRTGNSLDEIEKAFDAVKYGEFSAEPMLEIYLPGLSSPEVAPAGASILSAMVHYVPYPLKSGWNDKSRKALEKNVLTALSSYLPNITGQVVSLELLDPTDLERRYSLTNGHIWHGEHAIDQYFTRPLPSCTMYRTPVPGLFLGGSGSFPGGGITGAPGYFAARTLLSSLK